MKSGMNDTIGTVEVAESCDAVRHALRCGDEELDENPFGLTISTPREGDELVESGVLLDCCLLSLI